jgi:hypothetical protein
VTCYEPSRCNGLDYKENQEGSANRLNEAGEAPVAQLDRALPSEGKGHTFESCRVRHIFLNMATNILVAGGGSFGVPGRKRRWFV